MANQPGLQQRETLAGEMLQHQHSTKQEPDEEEEEEGGSVEVRPNVGGKRRYSEHMCESDEDDFAGFEEDAASSENGTINSPRPLESMYEAMLTAAEKKLKKNIKLVEDDSVSDLQNSLKQEDMDIMGGTALGESNKNLLKRKVNVQINTQDDIFKVPFKYGWKRELVYRANMEGNSKDKGEVYYITPNGKKLRTRNDIVSALHDDLTMDNFTFAKEPVGGTPEEETIRSAKSYSNVPKRSMPSAAHSTSMDNSGDLGKRVPKPKMPKGASPPLPTYNARASGHGQTPLSKSSTLNTHILTKVNATGASSLAAASGQRSNAHGVTGIPKANENSGISGKQAKAGVKNKVETCTIQCLPAMGMIPQLQCMVCYCMYHPECVNATTAEALARRFTCKSCMEDSMTAEIQHQQTYKESFGKFGTNTNGNGNINAAKPLVATNNGGSVSSKLVAKPTQNSSTPKEKAKRSQQHTAGSKTVTPAANASEGTCALSIAPTKDIPPQDVLVIGTHEYVVVPKGKPTGVKSKKSSSKSTNPLPQTPIKTSDDGRKMNNSAISGSTSSVKQTNCATDRVSVDDTSLTGGPGGGTHRHGGSAVGQNGSGRDPSNFLSDVSAGYACLMLSFNYLKVQELLRACSVCRMWNHLGNHPRFWKTVRMKNSYISDWAGMIAKLRKNGTKHLDLRKVLNVGSNDEMWQSFNEHIGQADQIEVIDLCRCSSTVVGNLLRSNPKLRVVNALAIKNDPIEFVNFEHGVNLEELRLKSSAAISLEGDLQQLAALRNLKHLSLTSISKLGATSIEALGSLLLLESLELGECTEMGSNLANVLTNLTALKRLRLEKGQENFDMFTILDGISKVRTLNQLELINCDVKTGFDRHISNCTNVKKLLLIPTYVSQSAATNRMVLKGIIKLHQTLETVVWAITVELLRVTELYIDANVEDAENQMGGSIPILKPVPGSDDPPSAVGSQLDLPEEVEIVPLKRVHSILKRKVPNTKLQILKIPFNNTWKQTLCDIS